MHFYFFKFFIIIFFASMPFQFKIGEIDEEPSYPKGGGGRSSEDNSFTCKCLTFHIIL